MGERANILYPSYSDRVCIVLVEPAIDGNIGAVARSMLNFGTSGKREHGDKISFRHFLLPDELPNRLDDTSGLIALVFGTEGKGLSTEDLHLCDFLCTVPTWEGYPILNLSHAVTLVCSSWFVNEISNASRDVSRLAQAVPVPENKRNGIEETLTRVILRGMPKDDEISRILGVINKATQAFEDE